MTVYRVNPANISTSLKEAVVDSLLNLTYSRVSGSGTEGEYIYGSKPQAKLNSGFLLPQRNASGDDEVTSPIWISSHGIQLQIKSESTSVISIKPRFSVYVRVVPVKEDFERPNCKPVFRLRREILREVVEA